jgi:outer membrane lipoprotein-sorting protein
MRFRLLFLLLIPVVSFAQGEKMSEREAFEFRVQAEHKAQSIETLATNFVQQKHMSFLSQPIETSGEMLFESPDKLLWKYTKPYVYSIVFSENKVHINNEGAKSTIDVGNNKTFEKINQLIIGSVSGNLFDDESFEISIYKNSHFNTAVLIPKTSIKQYISKLELYFSKEDYTVEEVKLIEPSGDFTHIKFKNKKTNIRLEPNTFTNK